MKELKQTPEGKSYWNSNGAYSELFDQLEKDLVPSSGPALTFHGELLRGFANLNYENGNNGNCNAIDIEQVEEWTEHDCNECYGDGEVLVWNDDTEEDEYETCGECGGSGTLDELEYYDGEVTITDKWDEALEFLENNLANGLGEEARKLRQKMISEKGDLGVEEYNALGDAVGYTIENTENYQLNYEAEVQFASEDGKTWKHYMYYNRYDVSDAESEFEWRKRRNDDLEVRESDKMGVRLLKKNEDGEFITWKTSLPKIKA